MVPLSTAPPSSEVQSLLQQLMNNPGTTVEDVENGPSRSVSFEKEYFYIYMYVVIPYIKLKFL